MCLIDGKRVMMYCTSDATGAREKILPSCPCRWDDPEVLQCAVDEQEEKMDALEQSGAA